ncbi:uncharacterized protein LOC143613699 [Bidens hawaiensis]|uniref:uncharacterized protein LOC143613699 n=1 Tax=Bidens hawaiensis TaxID=980011 RepID=UPI0040492EF4
MSQSLEDLGASINLMAYSLYEKLELGKLTPTCMSFSLADCSVKYPREKELIDVYDGRITLRVGDENITYDVVRSMKNPSDHDDFSDPCHSVYFLNSFIPGFDTCLDYICGADLIGVGMDE